MKKIIVRLIILIVATYVVYVYIAPFLTYLYSQRFSVSQTKQEILSSTNNAVQIVYNVLNLIIAIIIIAVAYDQLKKTRDATTVQTLINIDYYLRSDDFLKKRKKLANLISVNGLDELKTWLGKIESKKSPEEADNLAIIKNIFESVIYQFELIGHFYKNKIFSIEDVYQLFSIEVQNYWVLMSEVGYIKYIRENESQDFYDKFENLFYDTLKQEIINEYNNFLLKSFFKFYYWSNAYKFFYEGELYLFIKVDNRISLLSKNIRKRVDLFLIEEKNIIS